ncbi:hypothetical protein PLANPX_4007 [Lacipirellula parvula]|uniref:Uncharacterized protein n=1 Tax=Lacipirellula parvula TaxID=2650471 RepID=A0A5K7XDC8_9BACT|nr:hypothetical protein PLANPX_4007 [Lacipirellula parvula]
MLDSPAAAALAGYAALPAVFPAACEGFQPRQPLQPACVIPRPPIAPK